MAISIDTYVFIDYLTAWYFTVKKGKAFSILCSVYSIHTIYDRNSISSLRKRDRQNVRNCVCMCVSQTIQK